MSVVQDGAAAPVTAADARPRDGDGAPEVELVGRVVPPLAALSGTARGLVEQVRRNLGDASVRFLVSVLFAAQAADLLTTHVALQRPGMLERNPLFRVLFAALPGVADAVKLTAMLAIVLLALALLPLPRARHAMLFAAAISLVAPIANVMTLLGRF